MFNNNTISLEELTHYGISNSNNGYVSVSSLLISLVDDLTKDWQMYNGNKEEGNELRNIEDDTLITKKYFNLIYPATGYDGTANFTNIQFAIAAGDTFPQSPSHGSIHTVDNIDFTFTVFDSETVPDVTSTWVPESFVKSGILNQYDPVDSVWTPSLKQHVIVLESTDEMMFGQVWRMRLEFDERERLYFDDVEFAEELYQLNLKLTSLLYSTYEIGNSISDSDYKLKEKITNHPGYIFNDILTESWEFDVGIPNPMYGWLKVNNATSFQLFNDGTIGGAENQTQHKNRDIVRTHGQLVDVIFEDILSYRQLPQTSEETPISPTENINDINVSAGTTVDIDINNPHNNRKLHYIQKYIYNELNRGWESFDPSMWIFSEDDIEFNDGSINLKPNIENVMGVEYTSSANNVWNFDNPNDWTLSNDNIEIINGSVQLKTKLIENIESQSLPTTPVNWTFDNSSDWSYDIINIEFSDGSVKLKSGIVEEYSIEYIPSSITWDFDNLNDWTSTNIINNGVATLTSEVFNDIETQYSSSNLNFDFGDSSKWTFISDNINITNGVVSLKGVSTEVTDYNINSANITLNMNSVDMIYNGEAVTRDDNGISLKGVMTDILETQYTAAIDNTTWGSFDKINFGNYENEDFSVDDGVLSKLEIYNEEIPEIPGISVNLKVLQLESGLNFSVCLLENGNLYVRGANDKGQLGLGIDTPVMHFWRLSKQDVIKVACGDEHLLAIGNDYTLYGTGNNTSGQLGLINVPLGSPSKDSLGRRIGYSQNYWSICYPDKTDETGIRDVWAGGDGTIVQMRHIYEWNLLVKQKGGTDYRAALKWCGNNDYNQLSLEAAHQWKSYSKYTNGIYTGTAYKVSYFQRQKSTHFSGHYTWERWLSNGIWQPAPFSGGASSIDPIFISLVKDRSWFVFTDHIYTTKLWLCSLGRRQHAFNTPEGYNPTKNPIPYFDFIVDMRRKNLLGNGSDPLVFLAGGRFSCAWGTASKGFVSTDYKRSRHNPSYNEFDPRWNHDRYILSETKDTTNVIYNVPTTRTVAAHNEEWSWKNKRDAQFFMQTFWPYQSWGNDMGQTTFAWSSWKFRMPRAMRIDKIIWYNGVKGYKKLHYDYWICLPTNAYVYGHNGEGYTQVQANGYITAHNATFLGHMDLSGRYTMSNSTRHDANHIIYSLARNKTAQDQHAWATRGYYTDYILIDHTKLFRAGSQGPIATRSSSIDRAEITDFRVFGKVQSYEVDINYTPAVGGKYLKDRTSLVGPHDDQSYDWRRLDNINFKEEVFYSKNFVSDRYMIPFWKHGTNFIHQYSLTMYNVGTGDQYSLLKLPEQHVTTTGSGARGYSYAVVFDIFTNAVFNYQDHTLPYIYHMQNDTEMSFYRVDPDGDYDDGGISVAVPEGYMSQSPWSVYLAYTASIPAHISYPNGDFVVESIIPLIIPDLAIIDQIIIDDTMPIGTSILYCLQFFNDGDWYIPSGVGSVGVNSFEMNSFNFADFFDTYHPDVDLDNSIPIRIRIRMQSDTTITPSVNSIIFKVQHGTVVVIGEQIEYPTETLVIVKYSDISSLLNTNDLDRYNNILLVKDIPDGTAINYIGFFTWDDDAYRIYSLTASDFVQSTMDGNPNGYILPAYGGIGDDRWFTDASNQGAYDAFYIYIKLSTTDVTKTPTISNFSLDLYEIPIPFTETVNVYNTGVMKHEPILISNITSVDNAFISYENQPDKSNITISISFDDDDTVDYDMITFESYLMSDSFINDLNSKEYMNVEIELSTVDNRSTSELTNILFEMTKEHDIIVGTNVSYSLNGVMYTINSISLFTMAYINDIIIDETIPLGTDIKYSVSFNQKSNWTTPDGIITDFANGVSSSDMINWLHEYDVSNINHFDIAIYLSSDGSITPSVNSIILNKSLANEFVSNTSIMYSSEGVIQSLISISLQDVTSIDSVVIEEDIYINTYIRYIISSDQRNSWYNFEGSVDIENIRTHGMDSNQLRSYLLSYDFIEPSNNTLGISIDNTLDIMAVFVSPDMIYTPRLDNIILEVSKFADVVVSTTIEYPLNADNYVISNIPISLVNTTIDNIIIDETIPTGTSIKYGISTDGGDTWTDKNNSSELSSYIIGVSGDELYIRLNISTTDSTSYPSVNAITLNVTESSDVVVDTIVLYNNKYLISELLVLDDNVGVHKIETLTINETKPSGTDIKYSASFGDNVWKIPLESSEVVITDFANGVSSIEFSNWIENKDFNNINIIAIGIYLMSDVDGIYTPSVDSIMLDILDLGNYISINNNVEQFNVFDSGVNTISLTNNELVDNTYNIEIKYYEPPESDRAYRVRNKKSGNGWFKRYPKNISDMSGAYPMSYRLTMTEHGIGMYIGHETLSYDYDDFAWFSVQLTVDNITGLPITDGNGVFDTHPIHCLYFCSKDNIYPSDIGIYYSESSRNLQTIDTEIVELEDFHGNSYSLVDKIMADTDGNVVTLVLKTDLEDTLIVDSMEPKIWRYVVRETSMNRPWDRHISATRHGVDSEAVFNSHQQQVITKNSHYLIKFPTRLTGTRCIYPNEDMDIFAFTSGSLVADGALENINIYKSDGVNVDPRVYVGLKSTSSNGMRVLMLSNSQYILNSDINI